MLFPPSGTNVDHRRIDRPLTPDQQLPVSSLYDHGVSAAYQKNNRASIRKHGLFCECPHRVHARPLHDGRIRRQGALGFLFLHLLSVFYRPVRLFHQLTSPLMILNILTVWPRTRDSPGPGLSLVLSRKTSASIVLSTILSDSLSTAVLLNEVSLIDNLTSREILFRKFLLRCVMIYHYVIDYRYRPNCSIRNLLHFGSAKNSIGFERKQD